MIFKTDIDFYENRFLMFVLDKMAYEYEIQGKKVIRMTLGKSELPLHPNIIKSIQEALGDLKKSTRVFPTGLPELKEELSRYYKLKYSVNVNTDNIIIGIGTSSIFRNIFYVLTDKDDEVLLPCPYYSLYRFSAQLTGAKIRYYNINMDTMRLDIESFIQNFSPKTKIVVINSPGNPLGNILTREELNAIDSIVDGQAVIINDEIYANMCFDEQCTSVMQLKNTKSIFITTDAFSKGFRMYSRRVGYCIVPDELVIPLTVIQHHTLLTIDPVVQYGAIVALKHQKEVENLKKLYMKRRNYTLERFDSVPIVKALHSEGGFYITLDCTKYMQTNKIATSLELAIKIMEDTNIATVPGSDFGIPYTLRLSYSTSLYNEGIDRLVKFFTK